jgi:caffeoyl-CoA O-methyltransferase
MDKSGRIMNNELFASVDRYISDLFVPADAALEYALQAMKEAGLPDISVSPNQGKFLHLLAKLSNAKNILEIGTLGGYSTIWLARALPENGRLITLELDPVNAAVAGKNIINAGLATIVDIRVGKALDLLPQIKAEALPPFDLVFIDADKPPYTEYFEWALQLARPGTILIADNVIREGKVLDTSSTDEKVAGVQRFNKMLAGCDAVNATIFQTVGMKEHDGMAIAIVK